MFQGCTASTILSNTAVNTCFDHVEKLAAECRYPFAQAPVKLLTTGYADDLGLGTGSSKGHSAIQNNQRVVDALNVWLRLVTNESNAKEVCHDGTGKGKPC